MKTLTLTLALLTTTSLYANEQAYTWVSTPFWKAPQVTKTQVRVSGLESELERSCQTYKKLIYNSKGEANLTDEPEKIERFRTTAISFNEAKFKAHFKLNANYDNSGDYNIELNIAESVVAPEKDILPNYTLTKSMTVISLGQMSNFRMTSLPGSLTEASKLAGLADSKMSVSKISPSEFAISFEGKDAACDFIEGKIKLEASAPTKVTPLLADTKFLLEFYTKDLTKIIADIMSSKDSSYVKSARLGYRMGKLIDSHSQNEDFSVSEFQLKNLMGKLFQNDQLEFTSNVFAPGTGYFILIKPLSKGTDTTVTLTL